MSQVIVTCKSCNNQFTGTFCNVCGEKVINQDDRKLKYFLSEFINAITFADNKLWRTLKNILISPGQYSLDFVDGKRRGYMKPISIFFLANLVYFLIPIFSTFNTNLAIQTTYVMHKDVAKKMVEQEITERGMSFKEYEEIYDRKTTELSKLFLIIMAVFIALFFWPIHYGSQHNLIADHLTVGLEVMTFIITYCTIILSILLYLISLLGPNLLSDAIMSSLNLALLIYFIARIEYMFYGFRGIRLIFNTFLCISSILISLYMYRAFLFFITFWSL